MNRAVFFDRDGVLNVDHGYVADPARFEWMPEAREAVAWCRANGYLAVVITNQSGIARGRFSRADFEFLMDWMQAELDPYGGRLDAWYVCPHHPTEGTGELVRACDCRKPAPGLFLQACRELNIAPGRSVAIGDRDRDLQAAAAAGIRGYLYEGGSLLDAVQRATTMVDTERNGGTSGANV